mmetsp:Transcript_15139/g.20893  ORF Transcript_15139/g.20893 Transcript_15139/m.20893 type:complete len:457 (-) Transcript_15139:101-1471(-)
MTQIAQNLYLFSNSTGILRVTRGLRPGLQVGGRKCQHFSSGRTPSLRRLYRLGTGEVHAGRVYCRNIRREARRASTKLRVRTERQTESYEDREGIMVTKIEAFRLNFKSALQFIDNVGSWNIASSIVILAVFALETYSFREIDIMPGMGMGIDITDTELNTIEVTMNFIYAVEYCARVFASGLSRKYMFSPLGLVDFASGLLPGLFSVVGVQGDLLSGVRTFRVLRLLRLTNSEDNDRFVLLQGKSEVTIQLYNIFIEFVCIFFITAAVIFNIEHPYNPEFGDLGDSSYWAFLSLTGNEQPYPVITAPGRLTAVLAYIVALVVVPGQLARVLATLGGDMMRRNMDEMGARKKGRLSNESTTFNAFGLLNPVEMFLGKDMEDTNSGEDVDNWSPREVKLWLEEMGMGMYSGAFYAAKIDGETLLRFVDEEVLIEDFGVNFRVHRNKILAAISELRRN